MTNVIYKYRMDEVVIQVPIGVVRFVGCQFPDDSMPTVWIEHPLWAVDPEHPHEGKQEILMVGTGHPFDQTDGGYIGSAVCAGGALVWHLYSRMVS